jgi:uncharacterized membrane protein YkoI
MSKEQHRNRLLKTMATASVVVGLAAGSYGIASAATGSSSSSGSTAGTTTTQSGTLAAAPTASQPWGGQRSDETPLTGDALAKVKAIALDKVSGGTVVRVETDADGNAAYEAHMTKSDGTPVTVYVDKDFNFVSVETR